MQRFFRERNFHLSEVDFAFNVINLKELAFGAEKDFPDPSTHGLG